MDDYSDSRLTRCNPIPGYENRYVASEDGHIYALFRKDELAQDNLKGYCRVDLTDNNGVRKKF